MLGTNKRRSFVAWGLVWGHRIYRNFMTHFLDAWLLRSEQQPYRLPRNRLDGHIIYLQALCMCPDCKRALSCGLQSEKLEELRCNFPKDTLGHKFWNTVRTEIFSTVSNRNEQSGRLHTTHIGRGVSERRWTFVFEALWKCTLVL